MSIKGCFGKLPAHGDFIWEGLPGEFVTPWDQWQQQLMASIQQQSPDRWLEAYLQNPLWRFVIRDKALGQFVWCGVMMPSVDAVGRYFPFTMAEALPVDVPIISVVNSLSIWFESLEDLMLAALTQCVKVDALIQAFDKFSLPYSFKTLEPGALLDNRKLRGDFGAENPSGWMESIVNGVVLPAYPNPCIWLSHRPDELRTHFVVCDGYSSFSQAIALA